MKGDIDFAGIIEQVAKALLGDPNRHHSRRGHPRWGKNGSLAIDLEKGTWFDHEAKDGGGVLDLIRRHGHADPIEWLKREGIYVNGNGGTNWNGAKAKPKAAKPAPKKLLRTTGEFPGLGLPVRIYRYEESDLEVCRFEPKEFRQRHPDTAEPGWYIWNTDGCAIVPYKLPALRTAIAADEWVLIVEGEKDVESAAAIGLVATCNPMGANKWTDGFEQHFKGARICVLRDNDEPGLKHQQTYAAKLSPVAKELVTLELPNLPDKGDLSDFVGVYGTPQEAREAFWSVFKDQARAWQHTEAPQEAASGQVGALSEDACAIVFVDQHKDDLRYCHGGGEGWLIWEGHHWRRDTTRLVFNMLGEFIRATAKTAPPRDRKAAGRAAFCSGAEKIAQAHPHVAKTIGNFDQNDWLLGTPGGVVKLQNGDVRPGRPEDLITRLTAVDPAPPGTPCPLWTKFLTEASGGDVELVGFLWRFCGYCLTGSTREQKLAFVFGPGQNGKSVFVLTISGLFGAHAVTAAMSTFTSKKYESHPEELASLAGSRLVVANETREGQLWDEVRVKQLTAGDTIRARFMRQDSFEFRPTFKLMFVGNTAPEISTLDAAMRRRFLMVPFETTPANPDEKLEEKLKAEWPAILRWCLGGCLEWQREGLRPPASVQEATTDYLNAQDLFADFLLERCEIDPGNNYKRAKASTLYTAWSDFAKSAGREPGSLISFGMAMRRHGLKSKQIKEFNGKGYEGLQLRAPDMGWGDR